MNAIIQQALAYCVVFFLVLFVISLIQRGFFWKFMRARTSGGRLIICKLRQMTRDYFRLGRIEEGFLIFKGFDGDRRISINDPNVFYRSIGCTWVDIDDEKNALVKSDFSTVSGFDADKYNSLYLRALYKPQIVDSSTKLIILLLIIIIVAIGILVFFNYKSYNQIGILQSMVSSLKTTASNGVVAGAPL